MLLANTTMVLAVAGVDDSAGAAGSVRRQPLAAEPEPQTLTVYGEDGEVLVVGPLNTGPETALDFKDRLVEGLNLGLEGDLWGAAPEGLQLVDVGSGAALRDGDDIATCAEQGVRLVIPRDTFEQMLWNKSDGGGILQRIDALVDAVVDAESDLPFATIELYDDILPFLEIAPAPGTLIELEQYRNEVTSSQQLAKLLIKYDENELRNFAAAGDYSAERTEAFRRLLRKLMEGNYPRDSNLQDDHVRWILTDLKNIRSMIEALLTVYDMRERRTRTTPVGAPEAGPEPPARSGDGPPAPERSGDVLGEETQPQPQDGEGQGVRETTGGESERGEGGEDHGTQPREHGAAAEMLVQLQTDGQDEDREPEPPLLTFAEDAQVPPGAARDQAPEVPRVTVEETSQVPPAPGQEGAQEEPQQQQTTGEEDAPANPPEPPTGAAGLPSATLAGAMGVAAVIAALF